MAYDRNLEQRIDAELANQHIDLEKKKMFGGICYFAHDSIAFGVRKDELLVRVDEAEGENLFRLPGIRRFEMGKRVAMRNWYLAGGAAIAESAGLTKLLEIGLRYARMLPKKG